MAVTSDPLTAEQRRRLEELLGRPVEIPPLVAITNPKDPIAAVCFGIEEADHQTGWKANPVPSLHCIYQTLLTPFSKKIGFPDFFWGIKRPGQFIDGLAKGFMRDKDLLPMVLPPEFVGFAFLAEVWSTPLRPGEDEQAVHKRQRGPNPRGVEARWVVAVSMTGRIATVCRYRQDYDIHDFHFPANVPKLFPEVTGDEVPNALCRAVGALRAAKAVLS